MNSPYNNPTETYRYYSLPFCEEHEAHEDVASAKKGAQKHRQRLGEQMVGDRKESSPYAVKFKESLDTPRTLCEITLTTEDMNLFTDAIRHSYFFEMLIEDLPMWGYIGDIINDTLIVGEAAGTEKILLFPHLHFVIGTNKDNIVSANVNTDISQTVDITDTSKPKTIQFSYSVEFIDEKIEWKQRMKIYSHSSFAPYVTEIHWLSIINSFVLVLLLTAFLAIILMRVLKNGIGSLCELFMLEECVFLSIMRTCGLLRQKITGGKSICTIEHLKWDALLSQYELRDVEISTSKLTLIGGNKNSRKNMTFIRIGTKSSSSYTKPIK